MVRAVMTAGGVALLVTVGAAAGVGAGPVRGPHPDAQPAAVVRATPDAEAGGRGAGGAPDARRPVHPADGGAPVTLRPPVDGPMTVARPFRAPPHPWAAGHRGVDLAARPGGLVRAPEAGVVTFAGTVVDRGVVTVAHDGGLRSSLEPVDPSVRPGRRVLRGAVVGTVAATPGHCAPAPCLHWGLRRGDVYVDPLRWVLERGPIVLLPTD